MIARLHLFVSGGYSDRLEKARHAGAEAVTIDIRDAV